MTIQPFSNPIAAGANLVQVALQSPNFSVANQTGWAIYENGDAVFYGLEINGGTLVITESGGVFVYSGTPALGNLLISIAGAAGTDSYGNTYEEGIVLNAASGNQIQLRPDLGAIFVYEA